MFFFCSFRRCPRSRARARVRVISRPAMISPSLVVAMFVDDDGNSSFQWTGEAQIVVATELDLTQTTTP